MNELESVTIRTMRDGDIASVAALCAQFGFPASAAHVQGRFQKLRELAHHQVLVAELESKVVGWVHAYEAPSLISDATCEGGGLVVDASCRNVGIGKMLVGAAEQWARDRNCQFGLLATHTARVDAHRFYSSLGYETLFTTYFMRKDLDRLPKLPKQDSSSSL